MLTKMWNNVREYLEQPPSPGTAVKTTEESYYSGREPITTRIFERSNLWKEFAIVEADFEDRSEAFKKVWDGINAGPYQQRPTNPYLYNEGDTSMLVLRQRLEPIQYFCESVVQQVGLGQQWTTLISCVSLGDQYSFVDSNSFICYVIELAPSDESLVKEMPVDRQYGDRTNWPTNPSRPPVPADGIRIPLLACVIAREGTVVKDDLTAKYLQKALAGDYLKEAPEHNGLRAIIQTAWCVQVCYLPQAWYCNSEKSWLFDYQCCDMDPKTNSWRGVLTIFSANENPNPTLLMAQQCLDGIFRLLPQWRVPYALWETNEYAPYPHCSYMPPADVSKCQDCPRPLPCHLRAWSEDSCKNCGGWGYVWYNEDEDRNELYWKPLDSECSWDLEWVASGGVVECDSPELVGQTTDGRRPVEFAM